MWTGGLPHLPGVPHLHVNRPLVGKGRETPPSPWSVGVCKLPRGWVLLILHYFDGVPFSPGPGSSNVR